MKFFMKNFVYQALFQIVKLLMPVLTVPLVSYALGPDKLGIYNYTTSIAQYFILFASLGMGFYGQRLIATVRDDKFKLSKAFWELESLSIIVTISSIIFYAVFVINSDYKQIFLIQSLTIIAVAFDISWLFKGLEDFKKTSLRSVFISFMTFVLIYIFVKNENDLYKYILIQSAGLLGSQLIMWPFLINRVTFVKIRLHDIYQHLFRVIQYFIPQISMTLYANIGKTFLGIMSTKSEVAFFSNSLLIISVVITFVSTADSVLLPRLSYLNSRDNKKAILNILNVSFDIQLYFTIPIFFGLSAIARNLVPWFFGESFLAISKMLPVLAILCIIKPLGSAVTNQWLLPLGKLKIYNISIILGAIICIVLNSVLIKNIGVWGAIISIIFCELFITVTRIVDFLKDTGFKFNYRLYSKFVLVGIIMGVICNWFSYYFEPSLVLTLVQCLIGGVFYLSITTINKWNPIFVYRKEKLSENNK